MFFNIKNDKIAEIITNIKVGETYNYTEGKIFF